MPYIGNIVQDFSVNNAMLNTDSVTSIKIDDGTIVNADINDSAAIDVSKLSGVLPLAGGTLTGDLTLSGTAPKIVFTDTNNDPDYQFKVDSGVFTLERTAGNDQFRFNADGSFFLGGNFNTNSLISGANGLAIEGATTFNDSGADVDFRVEGDTNAHLLFVDASADKIGINESSPSHKLVVGGDIGVGFTTPNDAARQLNFNVNRGSAGDTLANINWQWNSKFVAQIRGIAGADTTNKDDAHLAFFTSAANNLVERLRILSDGKVGISTSSPTAALSIKGADTSTGSGGTAALELRQGDANNEFVNLAFQTGSAGPLAVISAIADATGVYPNTTGQLTFNTQVGSGIFERMRIDSDGRVGIGLTPHTSDVATNVTEGLLQTDGNIDIRYPGTNSDPAGARYLNFINTDTTLVAGQPMGGLHWIGMDSDNPNSITAAILADCSGNAGTSSSLLFNTGGSERMRIDATTGNVGIGTNAPDVKLDIARLGSAWTGQDPVAGTAAHFHNGNNATTSPSYLGLGAGTASISGINFADADDADVGRIHYSHSDNSLRFGTNGTAERMRVGSDGKVGIGTTSPNRTLTVQSNGGQMSINDTDNTSGGIFCNAGLFALYARGNSQLGDGGTGGVFEVQTHEGGGSTSQKFRVDGPGKLSTGGEGSPDVSGGGLCLNQGAADTNIFTCKSSDIAHGVTTLDETDTYFSIRKASGAKGGVRFQGFTDTAGADGGFEFYAVITDDSAQSYQGMEFKAGKANGTGTTNIAANRRIAVFKNNDGTRIANITGTGITFGDDREAANALDDYEEGTWTPSIYNGGSPSYSQQAGLYTKIGNLVRHIFVISFSGASLGTNSRIQGLPFAYNSTFETSTNMGRIGTAWNDAESAGNRACHAVGHTGSGTQMIYVDLLTSGTDKTLRGFFEMRVP